MSFLGGKKINPTQDTFSYYKNHLKSSKIAQNHPKSLKIGQNA